MAAVRIPQDRYPPHTHQCRSCNSPRWLSLSFLDYRSFARAHRSCTHTIPIAINLLQPQCRFTKFPTVEQPIPKHRRVHRNHRRPSRIAASISSPVMNFVIFERISSTRIFARAHRSCTAAFRSSSDFAPASALNSAITSWFKLRRFRFACSFSRAYSSSGRFRTVNIAKHSL